VSVILTSGYAMWFTAAPKTLKIQVFGVTQPPGVVQPLFSRGHNYTRTCNISTSLIHIGSKTAEKNSAQTNKQTDKPTDTTKIVVTWPWTNNLHSCLSCGLRTCCRQQNGSFSRHPL